MLAHGGRGAAGRPGRARWRASGGWWCGPGTGPRRRRRRPGHARRGAPWSPASATAAEALTRAHSSRAFRRCRVAWRGGAGRWQPHAGFVAAQAGGGDQGDEGVGEGGRDGGVEVEGGHGRVPFVRAARGGHLQRRHLPYLPRLGHRNLSPDHDGPPPNRPRSHNLTTGCSCHWVPSTALRSGERPAERDDSCGAPCPVLAQGSVLGEQGRDDDEGRSNFPTRCSEVGQTCSGDLPTHCVALAGARRAVRGRARTRVRRCRTGRT